MSSSTKHAPTHPEPEAAKLTSEQRFVVALLAAAVFWLIGSNALYMLTNWLLSFLGLATFAGGNTAFGNFLHAVVVFIVVWLVLYWWC